jgi:hypothetical protein
MRFSPHKIAAVVLFAVVAAVFLRWIPDDAFISFRYASNFADGHGLVFNPGERVEGYSNFLWTIILGLAHRAGLNIVGTAVTLSVVCALAMVLLALELFEGIAGDVAGRNTYRSHRWAVSLVLVVSLPMAFWASSGLETCAAALFLLLGALLHLKAERENRPEVHVGSIAAYCLVAVLRPEGMMYFALNAVVVYVRRRRRGLLPRSVVAAVVVSCVLLVVFLASRTLYYGSLVPNTYWAKPSTTIWLTKPLLRGVRYLLRYFVVSGLVLLIPIVVLAFFRAERVRYTVRYLLGLLAVQMAFIVWVGGDVLRFDRFTVSFHPILLALVLAGAVSWEATRGKRALLRMAVWGGVAAALLLNTARIYRAESKYCIHDWMHARFHANLGRALARMLPPDATLVFNEVGAVPYYSGLVTYDMIGLTDKTVGSIIFESFREYGTAATDMCRRSISDYLFSMNPTCVILPSYGPIDLVDFSTGEEEFHPIWYGIYTHPKLRSDYRADFSVSHSEHKWLNVFVRKDITLDHGPLEQVAAPECVHVVIH